MTGPDQVRTLLSEFSGEIRQRLDGLAAAVEAGDAEGALRRAHMLKGSARTLALTDLAAAMERVEDAYRAEPPHVQDARDAVATARLAAETAPSERDDVAHLGHALRTPLNVVLGFAHLLRDAGLAPEAREHADAIVRAAEQMAALIDQATAVDREEGDTAGAPTAGGRAGTAPVTVLCIEDDPASARLVEELLVRIPSVRVFVSGTGAEGVALAEREHPDLVLLDPGLPDLSGVETLRGLRSVLGDRADVVVVTGETRPERLQSLLAAGATECVTKPVETGRLQALVERVRPG